MAEFKGPGVINLVPFTSSDVVNEDEYRRHVEFTIENGMRMIMPISVAGSGIQLSDAERRRVIELTVAQAAGRAFVFPSCYLPVGTRNLIEWVNELETLGADGAYLPTPVLYQSGPEAMYEHHRAILAGTRLPIIVYNSPATTGTDCPSSVIARLLDEFPGRILGYKQHVMTDLPFDVDRLSAIPVAPACFDRFTWTGLSLGCRAQVTAGASVVPGRIASIFRQWDAGERDAAKATFDALMPFFELPMKLYKGHRDHYSSLYYYAVGRIGFDVGQPRLPSLWPVPSELASAIDRELDRLELV